MRPAVAEDPDYYWGWSNLVEWLRTAGEPADYLHAAENLVRLAGEDPVAAGYLGDARSRTGDRAGAKAEFDRGFRLAPDHAYTATRLFDMMLEDGELDAAASCDGVAEGAQRRAVHAGARGQAGVPSRRPQGGRCSPRTALRHARYRLGMAASRRPTDCFTEAGWEREAESIYERALDRPEVLPQVAILWVDHRVSRRRWRCHRPDRGSAGAGRDWLPGARALPQRHCPSPAVVAPFRLPPPSSQGDPRAYALLGGRGLRADDGRPAPRRDQVAGRLAGANGRITLDAAEPGGLATSAQAR